MASLDSYYAAVNSLGNYVNSTTAIDNAITTTATTGTGWYQLGNISSYPIGAIGGALIGNYQQQFQQAYQQPSFDVPKPKKNFSRVLDALRTEIKEWCGDALVIA